MPDTPPPSPERDRRLAAQPRHGPRRAVGMARMVDYWMRGPEAKRLRRLRHIGGALKAVLSEHEQDRVAPVAAHKGTLTVEVADHLLLAELRNHRYHRLIDELVQRHTGISRIRFRIARSRR